MRVRECDRCGRVYHPYVHKHNSVTRGTYNIDNELEKMDENYDLCPQCTDEYESWFNAYRGDMPALKIVPTDLHIDEDWDMK